MRNKIIKDTLVIISIILLIFQSAFARATSGMVSTIINSFDELLAMIMLIIVLLYRAISSKQIDLLVRLLLFLSIGFLGTFIYELQPAVAVVKDVVNCSKFFITLLGVMSLYRNDDYTRLIYKLQFIFSIIVFIFFILAVADQLFTVSFLQHSARRFGRYALQICYYHPAVLAQTMVFMLSVLSYPVRENKLFNTVLRYCAVIMIFLTFRTKAMVFALLYIFITNYKILLRLGKYRYLMYIFLFLGVLLLASDSFDTYYGSMEYTSRGLLTLRGMDVAKEAFPIGKGFASYGSAAAAEYYSPLYTKYGFDQIYGLGKWNTNYATDIFWPAIFGEFGYLGFIIFIILLYPIIFKGINLMLKTRNGTVPYLTLLGYLIVCTTSGTGFFNPIAVLYAMIMGLFIEEK